PGALSPVPQQMCLLQVQVQVQVAQERLLVERSPGR
ncbi:hypothetical protein Pgy4_37686, partial [Pseudomonas savastanoi pv. glycinea str. race 4]